MSETSDVAISAEPAVSEWRERPSIEPSERLMSLDALRGFDMFWIIGGTGVIVELCKAVKQPFVQWIGDHYPHIEWEGVHFEDLIFALFLFIVGVSLVFSLGKQIRTRGRGGAVKRILLRSLTLYVLGLIFYGGLSHRLADVRLLGVLQRIAICYLFTD